MDCGGRCRGRRWRGGWQSCSRRHDGGARWWYRCRRNGGRRLRRRGRCSRGGSDRYSWRAAVITEFRAIGYTLTTLGTKHELASGLGAYRAAIVPRQAIRFNVDISGCAHLSDCGKVHQALFQAGKCRRAPASSAARRHAAVRIAGHHVKAQRKNLVLTVNTYCPSTSRPPRRIGKALGRRAKQWGRRVRDLSLKSVIGMLFA
jgi:hypothetical protein